MTPAVRVVMGIGALHTLRVFLMINSRLSRREFAEYERAEAILVGGLLRQIPVANPESVIWDNRRKPK